MLEATDRCTRKQEKAACACVCACEGGCVLLQYFIVRFLEEERGGTNFVYTLGYIFMWNFFFLLLVSVVLFY